eukprot:6433005-Prymnesium_polylepis.2
MRFEPTEIASRSAAFSHFLFAPSHTYSAHAPSPRPGRARVKWRARVWAERAHIGWGRTRQPGRVAARCTQPRAGPEFKCAQQQVTSG